MLTALSRALYRHSRWRTVVALLLVCAGYFWVFNYASHFPFSNPALIAAGCGEGLLDLRPYYNASAAHQALDCYGVTGRAIYRHFLMADTSFLLIYGPAFALLLTRLLATLTTPTSRWRIANLLPLSVALADALENLALFVLLAAYPRFLSPLGNLAGLATSTKWVLTLASLATLAGCVGTHLWRRIRQVRSRTGR